MGGFEMGRVEYSAVVEVDSLLSDLLVQICDGRDESSRRLVDVFLEHPAFQAEYRRQIDCVLADCVQSVRHSRVVLDEKMLDLASTLGVMAAAAAIPIDQLAIGWRGMFDTFLANLQRVVDECSASPDEVQLIIRTLHQSIAERSRLSAVWYETALTQRMERVQVADRKRMARELHDWFGSNLSLAIRKLELHQIEQNGKEVIGGRHLSDLNSVLVDLFDGARRFAAGLRLHTPVSSIGTELRSFVESANFSPMAIDVFVKGNEALVASHIRSEMFILVREALRNILAHSHGTAAFVVIEITDGRMCAVVQDDGRGFTVPAEYSSSTGTGLLSMRERVENLNGKIHIASAPMCGTRIEIWIPTEAGIDDSRR